jgi:peptidoglycan/xylan/chitin deacetylase (PgdA/CDA1 family)
LLNRPLTSRAPEIPDSKEENIKATFLTCGAIAERFPEAVQAILDHGQFAEGDLAREAFIPMFNKLRRLDTHS